jgi:hypothetical protein
MSKEQKRAESRKQKAKSKKLLKRMIEVCRIIIRVNHPLQ